MTGDRTKIGDLRTNRVRDAAKIDGWCDFYEADGSGSGADFSLMLMVNTGLTNDYPHVARLLRAVADEMDKQWARREVSHG